MSGGVLLVRIIGLLLRDSIVSDKVILVLSAGRVVVGLLNGHRGARRNSPVAVADSIPPAAVAAWAHTLLVEEEGSNSHRGVEGCCCTRPGSGDAVGGRTFSSRSLLKYQRKPGLSSKSRFLLNRGIVAKGDKRS
jgi:hypothetical protein